MKRALVCATVGLLALVACDDQQPLAPQYDPPVFQISDGHNGGNPGFFFLAPIRRLSDDATVPKTGFNPNLSPVIEVYECSGTNATGCVLPLGALKSRITKTSGNAVLNRLYVSPTFREYDALWDTHDLGLRTDRTYRIQVSVGGALLGFADVDVVRTIKEAARVDRDDLVPLLQNLILPIRFWVGNNALCAGSACASKTIDLAVGGQVELLGGGEDFRLDIPAGTTASWGGQAVRNVTLNLEVCSGIDVDLPKMGACLRVTSFFDATGPGELEFTKPLLISLCVLNGEIHDPNETRQEGLFTLHQQDGSVIRALPHAAPNCGPLGLGMLDKLKNFAARMLAPQAAHAATRSMALHVGGGGETGALGAKCTPAGGSTPSHIMMAATCPPSSPRRSAGPERGTTATVTPPHSVSDFQFALPAMMDYVDPDDAQRSAPAGTALPTAVKVTDFDGAAVQGATVTFVEPALAGPGTIVGTATSNADGVAQILWTIRAGPNTVVATGRGIAAQNNYPGAPVKPFSPDVGKPTGGQSAVALGTGRVTFVATGETQTFPSTTVLRGLEYPTGLWLSGSDAYLTETAGRNTSFGGKITLLHWTPDGGGSVFTLLNNPVNSDAVVLDSDGRIYLASYVAVTPGEQGRVSRVLFDIEAGWIETPVTDVAIAAHDMFMDDNDDIYLIGSSDNSEATNLYRLAAGAYDAPVGLESGLGRAYSVTKVASAIYYGSVDDGEVHRIDDGINEVWFTHTSSVLSLASDGVYLYYGDIAGSLRRRHLATGADEQLVSAPGQQMQGVRYEPLSGRLYYLLSGTQAAQYKDGTLNYITVNTPVP